MIATVVLSLAAATRKSAKADGFEGDLPPRHVEVSIVRGAAENGQGLEAALTELLARLAVTVHFSTLATVDTRQIMGDHTDEPPAVARVWIDLRDAGHIALYLAGTKQDRFLVRNVPLVGKIDEVAREEVAHIVEATVDALLVGGRIGVVTDEPTDKGKAEARSPRSEAPFRPRLDLGIGYGALLWSTAHPVLHGPAVFLGADAPLGSVRVGGALSGELRFPATIEGDPISTRLDQGALRAVAYAEVPLSQRWGLRGGLGGGVDWLRISPTAKEGAKVELEAPRFATLPMLRALAAVRYAFTPKNMFFFSLSADFDCLDTRFLVDRDASNQVLFHPWRVRPMALLGVASDVLH